MAAGNTYVNVHTDDGEEGDNTGTGDYISGEIRGQIKLYGTLPEPPAPTINPVTRIAFTLPSAQYISLKVYDATGREVVTLVDGMRSAGRHEVNFQATNIASGTYFYKLKAGEFTATRKMIVLRLDSMRE